MTAPASSPSVLYANGVPPNGSETDVSGADPARPGPPRLDSQQPYASSSRLPLVGNPQLSGQPWFAYPTPSSEQLEEELPPYHEGENVPLGPLLARVVRKGYGDLRVLVDDTLPPLSGRQKPAPIIEYAASTRQTLLKYLAVLRWKAQVDSYVYASSSSVPQAPLANGHGGPLGNGSGAASLPTPHSTTDTTDSPEYAGKGKGKAVERAQDEDVDSDGRAVVVRGKVSDAKRIEVFMAHQNAQQTAAIEHLRHTTQVVDRLRLRNPDLLTAVSILTTGTYDRLPTSLTQPFLPKPPLTNRQLLRTLKRLNKHIRFRLRCEEYIPPEVRILAVRDGKVHIEGGGGMWRAELTIINFGEMARGKDGKVDGRGRWWATGAEWRWRERGRERGVDDPGGDGDDEREVELGMEGQGRRLEGEERKEVLDLINMSVLNPREVAEEPGPAGAKSAGDQPAAQSRAPSGRATPMLNGSGVGSPLVLATPATGGKRKVEAPLNRLHNFIQHLCLSYQLEVLCAQALRLGAGRRRGQLIVDLDRVKKTLTLKYWIHPRPPPAPSGPSQAAVGKRNPPPGSIVPQRGPMVGGILTISLTESVAERNVEEDLLDPLRDEGMIPAERVLRMGLGIRWEVGEVGEGGGWKAGETIDPSALSIDHRDLSVDAVLDTALRIHAAHLTQHRCQPLLTLPRIHIFPSNPPLLVDDPSASDRSLYLRIPLPSFQKASFLSVGVSALNGNIEIEDDGAVPSFEDSTAAAGARSSGRLPAGRGMEDRGARARLACASVNEGKTRLGDDVGRLITAIITENLESQLRSLGHTPLRRLALRSQDLAKNDLHAASTIFLALPTSKSHHLVIKVTSAGLAFEILQLVRVPAENGVGVKLAVGQRSMVDIGLLRGRAAVVKRSRDGHNQLDGAVGMPGALISDALGSAGQSAFVMETKELRDVYIYANALVAQSTIELQLKARHIPYALQYPPTISAGAPRSRSPVAGLVPTFVVNAADLLKDRRAGDVAMPRVLLQIRGWWSGGVCSIVTIVQLRHRPTGDSGVKSAGSAIASPAAPTNSSRAARAEGITFDQASSIVYFQSDDLAGCVPGFLEQWERLSKVIIVAGEVNKLNKLSAFRDVRMLSFDLRTAIVAYQPGYFCSITYDPSTDSYVTSFARASAGGQPPPSTSALGFTTLPPSNAGLTPSAAALTPGAASGLTPGAMSALTPGSNLGGGEGNPHDAMAGLLSWRLNELVGRGREVGKLFIGLLRATLPFLLEVEDIRQSSPTAYPALVILTTHTYRLVWDVDNSKRYALAFTLTADNQSWLLYDGSKASNGLIDTSCGPLTEIPDFIGAVDKVWQALRARQVDGVIPPKPAGVSPAKSPALRQQASTASEQAGIRSTVLLAGGIKLDGGRALLLRAEYAVDGVRRMVKEVQGVLGTDGGGEHDSHLFDGLA